MNNFYLGQTPITQAQYKAVTGTDPTDRGENSDAQMDSVNWDHADEYCAKLTTLDRKVGVLPQRMRISAADRSRMEIWLSGGQLGVPRW